MTDDGRWLGLGVVAAAVAVSVLELRRPALAPEWAYRGEPGSRVRTTLHAAPAYTANARLEQVDEDTNTSKFWEYFLRSDGKADIHWGRIGTKGQWQKGISIAEAGNRFREKLANGYNVVE